MTQQGVSAQAGGGSGDEGVLTVAPSAAMGMQVTLPVALQAAHDLLAHVSTGRHAELVDGKGPGPAFYEGRPGRLRSPYSGMPDSVQATGLPLRSQAVHWCPLPAVPVAAAEPGPGAGWLSFRWQRA